MILLLPVSCPAQIPWYLTRSLVKPRAAGSGTGAIPFAARAGRARSSRKLPDGTSTEAGGAAGFGII